MSEPHPIRDDGIIYGRTSDDTQSGDKAQLTNLRRLARSLGVNVVAEVIDEGESGDDLERPGVQETKDIVARCHRQGHPISTLLLDKSDRFSRADSLDTSAVLATLRAQGVRRIATPSKVFDLWNPADRTMLSIECDHKNNPQLRDIARTVLDGMIDAARERFWVGGRVPIGYRLVREEGAHGRAKGGRRKRRHSGRLVLDERLAPAVLEAFTRYDAGELSTYGVAELLASATGRRWTRAGAAAVLRNPLYAGVLEYGRRPQGKHARIGDGAARCELGGLGKGDVVRIEGFPAIVSAGLAAQVVAKLDGKGFSRRRADDVPTPLAGLCRCGVCGAMMHSTRSKGHPYYRCLVRSEAPAPPLCRGGYKRQSELLTKVVTVLADNLLVSDAITNLQRLAGEAEEDARRRWEANARRIGEALVSCDVQLSTARRRLATAPDDMVEEYQRVIREVKADRERLESEARNVRADEPRPEDSDGERLERWLTGCREACLTAQTGEPALVNALLRRLVKEVVVYPPKRRERGVVSVGRIGVTLPDWLAPLVSRVRTTNSSACRASHDAHTDGAVLTFWSDGR